MFKPFLIASFALLITPITWANYEDDSNSYDYDYIIKELSSTRSQQESFSPDPFSQLKIHAGVAFTTSQIQIETENKSYTGHLQGAEANLGIDLFSPVWMAEGAVRSYSNTKFDSVAASMNEFDLKFIYHNRLARLLEYRLGLGISGRYLDFTDATGKTTKHTTPSSVFLMGIGAKLTQNLSLGTEISYRNSLVDETIDKSTLDASIKIGTHF